ncbi:hypothetical protein [Caballeronia sp. Sq4a]|uniref:hypothetical protein n=1 Tax=Caballeronia sp. Sq4a TaxID=2878152 RepID=UPI0020BE4F42|nr:hypothetical protein [Caballeronia sp. Sq4a]
MALTLFGVKKHARTFADVASCVHFYYGAASAGLKGWTGESSTRCPWNAGRAMGDTDAFPRPISS